MGGTTVELVLFRNTKAVITIMSKNLSQPLISWFMESSRNNLRLFLFSSLVVSNLWHIDFHSRHSGGKALLFQPSATVHHA